MSSVEENQTDMEFKSQGPLSLWQHHLTGKGKTHIVFTLEEGEVELLTKNGNQKIEEPPR